MNKPYRKSIVAFLDILGFRDKIQEAGSDPTRIWQIRKRFATISANVWALKKAQRAKLTGWEHLRCNMFSDSIVISSPWVSDDSFQDVADAVMPFQADCAKEGFFLRGAIASGNLYQDKDVMFVPAFIKAYDAEKLAVWPRVIVDPSVLKEMSEKDSWLARINYLLLDDSGISYTDYLTNQVFAQAIIKNMLKSNSRGTCRKLTIRH